MRRTIAFLFIAVASSVQCQSSFQTHGFVSAREILVEAQPSWTTGGVGRFDVGADGPGDRRAVHMDVAQIGIDWTPRSWLTFHADGLARHEPSGTIGSKAGIVQGYAEIFNEHWSLRAGSFWLPTSRENVDPLWTSRYTITYSALNSWIGQEVRPVGADLQYSPNFYMTFGATTFRDNDTMGTVLSSRGWTLGNRLSVYNESIPYAETPTVVERTRPIGKDLDQQNGYAERIRFQVPERAMIQVLHLDNRAVLAPEIDGQVPWLTKMNVVSGSFGANAATTLAAEWCGGSTTVGFPGGSYRMDFDTAYVLLSEKKERERWSVRVDRFNTRSHPSFTGDGGRESGHAITGAWLHDVNKNTRAGLEYSKVTGKRPGLAPAFDPDGGGSTLTLEVRYGF